MIQVMGKTPHGLMDFRTDILVRVPVFLEQIESTLRGISTEQLEGWVWWREIRYLLLSLLF
jgi:hypothetical protein